MWCSGLRIWHCHHRGTGDNCCAGSFPGLGTSTCRDCGQEQKETRPVCQKQDQDGE